MAVVATVDFSGRSDGSDLGSDFDPYSSANNGGPDFKMRTGVARPTTTSGNDSAELYNATTIAADHWNEVTLNSNGTGGSGSGSGPLVRTSTASVSFAYYRGVGNGAGWEIT